MFDIAKVAEVQRLLEELSPLEDKLMPNELEMVHHLKAKYAELAHTDFDDVRCLEVILRNVKVRQGFDFDVKKDAGRTIEVGR